MAAKDQSDARMGQIDSLLVNKMDLRFLQEKVR